MRTALVALGLAASLQLSPAIAADKTVTLGVLGAFAGPFAADAVEGYNGALLAAEEINAAGGVAGYQFNVEQFDTKEMTPDSVLSAVERLKATENLGAIVTPFGSLSGFEMDYVAEIGVPYMVAANSNQYRSIIAPNPDKFKNVWSLAPSYDAYQTEFPLVLEELGGHHGADRVAAEVVRAGAAAPVAVEPGERVGAARLQLPAQDVQLGHGRQSAVWRATREPQPGRLRP